MLNKEDTLALAWEYSEGSGKRYIFTEENLFEFLKELKEEQAPAQDERDRLLEGKGDPSGFVSAPLEPSLAMQNAGWNEIASQGIDPEAVEIGPIYRAMIAAMSAK